ncbi:MAG: ArnT family glycosyltransferase [Planctomycetota bacterium]|jgi:4-amino-4-deoxy-L-arabinose transferase-like glycosyltransferase
MVFTREARTLAAIVVASLVVRLAFAASSDVFQDEALYWWTAHAGVSFSPHPPLVPVAILCGERLLGAGVLGIRAGSLLWGTGGIVLCYLLGRDMYDRRTGVWAAALFASCPLFVAAGAAATPDALLLFLWLLFTYSLWHAAHSRRTGWWVLSAIVFAAGLYAKYMMVLAMPSAFLALCASKDGRRLLRSPAPWLTAAVGMVLFVPVFLAWNWRHGWAALAYHLSARHQWMLSSKALTRYVLGHAGILSPVLYIGVLVALVAVWRAWRRGEWRGAWLGSFGLVPILFFFIPSAFTEYRFIRAHWDAIGYAVGVIALAAMTAGPVVSEQRARRRQRLGAFALAVAVAMTLCLIAASMWPGLLVRIGARPPNRRTLGWRQLADKVRELERERDARKSLIVTDSFSTALCLGFHLDRRDGIYTLYHRRHKRYGLVRQLDEWGIDESALLEAQRVQKALYVHEYHLSEDREEPDRPTRIQRFFADVELVGEVRTEYGGRLVRHFGIYECQPLRPDASPPTANHRKKPDAGLGATESRSVEGCLPIQPGELALKAGSATSRSRLPGQPGRWRSRGDGRGDGSG